MGQARPLPASHREYSWGLLHEEATSWPDRAADPTEFATNRDWSRIIVKHPRPNDIRRSHRRCHTRAAAPSSNPLMYLEKLTRLFCLHRRGSAQRTS